MRNILILCLFTITLNGYAHEPNEAFFKISQKDNFVEIEAEIPWTLRNALLEFNPLLNNANSKADFEKTFIEYVKSNLILTSANGNNFEFVEFKELDNQGHSHQGKYLLRFEGANLINIKNTLLFNVYDNQKNYHSVSINAVDESFITTISNSEFILSGSSSSVLKYLWLLLALLPLTYMLKKQKKKRLYSVGTSLLLAVTFMTFSLLSCSNDNVVKEEVLIESTKPNILLVIADDMGLDATPGYSVGSIKPNMPNLESLKNDGIRFNDVWSNPVCSPTRGTILTGKYGFRTNVLKVDDAMSTSEVSLQSLLKSQNSGYNDAVIGKWHLSRNSTHPTNMGINYYAGLLGGGVQSYSNWNLTENGLTNTSTEYATTKLTDLAIDWIENQTQPWFLWLAYNAPHTPFHLPPNELHYQGNLPSDQSSIDANPLPYYLAMLEAMDTEMGRLINSMSIEEKNNTVIIFIGDNGTPNQVVQEYASNRAKGSLYQGGINVPMIVSGKGISRINASEDALINATDLFATILDITGVSITEINDSKSFKELFVNENGSKRDYIYSEIGKDTGGSDYTIRNKTHKYIKFDNGNEALFNLGVNPLESPNLLNSNQLPLSTTDEAIKNELILKLQEIRQ